MENRSHDKFPTPNQKTVTTSKYVAMHIGDAEAALCGNSGRLPNPDCQAQCARRARSARGFWVGGRGPPLCRLGQGAYAARRLNDCVWRHAQAIYQHRDPPKMSPRRLQDFPRPPQDAPDPPKTPQTTPKTPQRPFQDPFGARP